MFSPTNLAAPAVLAISPYVPGKPLAELERELGISNSIKLASNENPLGPGPLALAAIAQAATDIGYYPDANGFALKQALAQKHGWTAEGITLGNGSNDVLVMIAEAFLTPESEAVFSQYGFAVYPIATQATGATAKVAPALPESHPMALGHDLDAMLRLVTERTRVIFVANPNNPTGTWIEAEPLRAFLQAVPRTAVVVVDEAYIEYADAGSFPDASRWLAEFPNLIVTRTFSKAYGLAGLRVGYALSDPGVANLMNRVRQTFNVNSIALAAAHASLDDAEHLRATIEVNRAGMQQLLEGMKSLPVTVTPSRGNFILIHCGRAALPVYDSMLKHGVIVRPVGNYQLPEHLRLTIGTADQNRRMLDALENALGAA